MSDVKQVHSEATLMAMALHDLSLATGAHLPAECSDREAVRLCAQQAWQARVADAKLRDHFAGLAMQGMLSNSRDYFDCSQADVARMSYQMADAMLSAREGR